MYTDQTTPEDKPLIDKELENSPNAKVGLALLAIVVITLACPIAMIFNYAREEPFDLVGYAISGVCILLTAFWTTSLIVHITNVVKDPDSSLRDNPTTTALLAVIALAPLITGLCATPHTAIAGVAVAGIMSIFGLAFAFLFVKNLAKAYASSTASRARRFGIPRLPNISDSAVVVTIVAILTATAYPAALTARTVFPDNPIAQLGAGLGTLAVGQILLAIALLRARTLGGPVKRACISFGCAVVNGGGIGPMASSVLIMSESF